MNIDSLDKTEKKMVKNYLNKKKKDIKLRDISEITQIGRLPRYKKTEFKKFSLQDIDLTTVSAEQAQIILDHIKTQQQKKNDYQARRNEIYQRKALLAKNPTTTPKQTTKSPKTGSTQQIQQPSKPEKSSKIKVDLKQTSFSYWIIFGILLFLIMGILKLYSFYKKSEYMRVKKTDDELELDEAGNFVVAEI